MIEYFAASNIVEKFRELKYDFTRVSRNHRIKDGKGRLIAEVDLLLENGEYALLEGLYVVEQTGDAVRVSEPKKAAVW